MKESYQEDILLCKAIRRLDEKLRDKNIKPFTLNVCGGFALLLQDIRKNKEDYTDIDYIGPDLEQTVLKAVQEVAEEFGFDKNWINNDILLPGSSLEEIQAVTGRLNFTPKMQLSVISVNVLSKKDLLRLKLIAVDTSLMGVEFGGEFTRLKDFGDIRLLLEDLKMTPEDMLSENEAYIYGDDTRRIIMQYFDITYTSQDELNAMIKGIIKKHVRQKEMEIDKMYAEFDSFDDFLK